MNNVNNIDNISQVFHENDGYNDRTVTITMSQFPFGLPDKKQTIAQDILQVTSVDPFSVANVIIILQT